MYKILRLTPREGSKEEMFKVDFIVRMSLPGGKHRSKAKKKSLQMHRGKIPQVKIPLFWYARMSVQKWQTRQIGFITVSNLSKSASSCSLVIGTLKVLISTTSYPIPTPMLTKNGKSSQAINLNQA